MQQVFLKEWYVYTKLHGVISRKKIFTVSAVIATNLSALMGDCCLMEYVT
jgi:hypothetical protein